MARSSRNRRGNVVTLNMKDVEGKRPLVEPGDYEAAVEEVTRETGDKADYLKWVFTISDDDKDHAGQKLYLNTSLSEQSLWNLRGLLEALDVEIPDEEFDLDLAEMAGLEVMLSVEHEKYEGRNTARVVDYSPIEKKSSKKAKDEEEEEKPARSRRRGAKDDDDEPEEKPARGRRGKKEPAKISQADVNDMDQGELEDLIKDHKLDVDLEDHKTLRKMRSAVIDALEAEDLIED